MENQYDVVIGLGAMGAATLYQLAKLGIPVLHPDPRPERERRLLRFPTHAG